MMTKKFMTFLCTTVIKWACEAAYTKKVKYIINIIKNNQNLQKAQGITRSLIKNFDGKG